LLPKQEIEVDDDEYMEDPREELMQRLIEYRKFKEAAETFKEKELEAHQTYTRPPVIFENLNIEKTVIQGDISIYDMLGALGRMIERKKWKEPLDTRIQRAEIPIEERMNEVLNVVKQASRNGVSFDE